MKIKHQGDHEARRRKEYPPIEDFADAMYWASKGDDAKLREYYVKIDQVKAKYPKRDSQRTKDLIR